MAETPAIVVDDVTKHFRILVPTLFDPSLTPGWHSGRPDIPAIHSKAEQMRNAATLMPMVCRNHAPPTANKANTPPAITCHSDRLE